MFINICKSKDKIDQIRLDRLCCPETKTNAESIEALKQRLINTII